MNSVVANIEESRVHLCIPAFFYGGAVDLHFRHKDVYGFGRDVKDLLLVRCDKISITHGNSFSGVLYFLYIYILPHFLREKLNGGLNPD